MFKHSMLCNNIANFRKIYNAFPLFYLPLTKKQTITQGKKRSVKKEAKNNHMNDLFYSQRRKHQYSALEKKRASYKQSKGTR